MRDYCGMLAFHKNPTEKDKCTDFVGLSFVVTRNLVTRFWCGTELYAAVNSANATHLARDIDPDISTTIQELAQMERLPQWYQVIPRLR